MFGWLTKAFDLEPVPSQATLDRWAESEAEIARRRWLASLPTPVLDRLNAEALKRRVEWDESGGDRPEPIVVSLPDFLALREEFENQGLTREGAPWRSGQVILRDCVRVVTA